MGDAHTYVAQDESVNKKCVNVPIKQDCICKAPQIKV